MIRLKSIPHLNFHSDQFQRDSFGAMPERPQGNRTIHHHDFHRLNQGFLNSVSFQPGDSNPVLLS